MIQDFARTQKRVEYIDVASPMFDAQGNLPGDLFVADGLHPTPNATRYGLRSSSLCFLSVLAARQPLRSVSAHLRGRIHRQATLSHLQLSEAFPECPTDFENSAPEFRSAGVIE